MSKKTKKEMKNKATKLCKTLQGTKCNKKTVSKLTDLADSHCAM